MSPPPKLSLAHLPTPLEHFDALDKLVGTEVWIKRDDMTEGAAAGNKVRKLEYLLADALARRSTHVLTCGGEQSNHARATALLSARLGMRPCLFLRTTEPASPPQVTGNILLDRLAGACIRWLTAEEYEDRDRVMGAAADDLRQRGERPYVIPEGGSNGLGALGYVDAMAEIRHQLDLGLAAGKAGFDSIVHACGSGGTAAGLALGARLHNVATRVDAMAVCSSAQAFREVITRIVVECRTLDPRLGSTADVSIHDSFKGPGYAVASDEQLRFLIDVAREVGLVLDPVYTGKALFGLSRMNPRPTRALFLHTGGLPGLLAQTEPLAKLLPFEPIALP